MADVRMRMIIDGDADGAVREVKKVDRAMGHLDTTTGKTEKTTKRFGGAAQVAAGVGMVELTRQAFRFGKSATDAFRDASASMAIAEASLDKNNKGWRNHKDEIDKTINAHMDLSKFDDEDLYKSFAALARVTGDTDKALRNQQIAMDVARNRGISLSAATDLVNKAQSGQFKGLKALGIQLPKTATPMQALDALQSKFAGSAQRYGQSAAGEADSLALAWGNLQEDIGKFILPAVSALMQTILGGVAIIKSNWTTTKVLAGVLAGLAVVLGTVSAVMKVHAFWTAATTASTGSMTAAQWLLNAALNANPVLLIITGLVALGVALVVAYKKSETFRKIVDGAFSAVVGVAQAMADFVTKDIPAAFDTALGWVKRHWPAIAALVSGPFFPLVALATDAFGIRSALVGAFNGVITYMGGLPSRVLSKAQEISGAVGRGLRAGAAWAFDTVLMDRIVTPITNLGQRVLTGATNLSSKVAQGLRAAVWGMAELVQTRVVQPIVNIFDDVFRKGETLAGKLAGGIRDGAMAAWDGLTGRFTALLNRIIRVVNKIPFVDIPLLADGGVIRGPQLSVVGEDGPEVVIPVGAKRRKRGQQLLTQAAMMLGSSGDGPGDNRFMNTARGWGIPMLADGGVVLGPRGAGYRDRTIDILKTRARSGWGAQLADFARSGIANLAGMLPTPAMGNPVLDGIGKAAKAAAVAVIQGVEDAKQTWGLGSILDGESWSKSQMGKPYVWGGGHGGWNYNLPGYDCSGFASHAAKKAGSTLGAPGTTMSLINAGPGLGAGGKILGREPVYWGLRGMGSSDPRRQHMGIKFFDTWYQFGNPGHTGGTDSQWSNFVVPPGLPSYQTGVPYVPSSGPAMLHAGEMVLNRGEAAAQRAGRGGTVVNLSFAAGMEWLRQFVRVEVDDMAEGARRRGLAAGAVR